ncbi:MAG: hypothetical protein JWO52_1828, partial [Gammaproteobacteria bacterium]|nr:hypothetical protein [Gammaproteobacteria bacterium]
MTEVPTERLRLKDKRFLSPPLVGEPLYQCAKAAVVYGFDVGATLDFERNGTIVLAGIPGGFPPTERRPPDTARSARGRRYRPRPSESEWTDERVVAARNSARS